MPLTHDTWRDVVSVREARFAQIDQDSLRRPAAELGLVELFEAAIDDDDEEHAP